MKWLLVLIVVTLPGCGTSRRPTLDELTYAEARALEHIEVTKLEQALEWENRSGSKEAHDHYLKQMDRREEIGRVVKAAWEREKHAIPPRSGPKESEKYEAEMKEIYKDSEKQ